PAARGDLESGRRKGLGGGLRVEALLLPQAAHRNAALPARGVLATCGGVRKGADGSSGAQHLDLFALQLGGVEGHGFLHGDEGEQLQQVVLQNVPGGTDAVVVACAPAEPDVLGHRDLDVVDVVGVKQRVEKL